MKLRKTITVNGETVRLISEDIRLELYAPGRAMFQVKADSQLSGEVAFSMGYTAQATDQEFFRGYVEQSLTVDRAQQRLMCRELVGVMDAKLPLSLRHPTLQDVAKAYSEETGLVFAVPDKAYAKTRVPHFATIGTGYHGLDTIGDVFSITDYLWAQQGDGKVFVGSWADSRWASRSIDIDEEWFSEVTTGGGRTLPAIPALRPGVKLNDEYVHAVQLSGHEMVVKCAKRLKKQF